MSNQPYRISLLDLARETHSSASAKTALKRYQELQAAGCREPVITYSPRGGYSVRDPDAAILAENRLRHGAPPLR